MVRKAKALAVVNLTWYIKGNKKSFLRYISNKIIKGKMWLLSGGIWKTWLSRTWRRLTYSMTF